MKLAIVTSFPPSKVTLNQYGYHLVKHFAQNKSVKEVLLLTDFTEEAKRVDFEVEEGKLTFKDCWTPNKFKNIFTIYFAVRNANPDAVLLNLQFMKFGEHKVPASLRLLLPLILRLSGIPTITLLHNIMESPHLNLAGKDPEEFMNAYKKNTGNFLNKLKMKFNSILMMMKNVAKAEKQESEISVRQEEQQQVLIPQETKKVMAYGKFGTYKKVEKMIEAVEIIRNRSKLNIEIVIAGTDSPGTPGYLESVAEKYSDVEQLTFTGPVNKDEIQNIFAESAATVFPYTAEGESTGILPSFKNFGKAVVLPNLGNLETLINEDGYQGEFFVRDDAESMANAIQKIIQNDRINKMGRNVKIDPAPEQTADLSGEETKRIAVSGNVRVMKTA